MEEKATVYMADNWEFKLAGNTKCSDLNPKALFLFSAAKCAALTAKHIMEKAQVTPKRFEITVSGTLSTDDLQAESIYTGFNVYYNAEARTIEEQAKVARAINLTHDKHCGLIRMLRMIALVSHEIAIVSTEPAKV